MDVAKPPPLLYPGGFLLTKADEELRLPDAELEALIAGWRVERIGRYVMRFDETWRHSHAHAADAEVLLLGTAMDLDEPALTQNAAVAKLAHALDDSDAAFLDRLDALLGSYVMVVRRGSTHWVLHDATAIEPLAYDIGGQGTLVASHPALIADIRGYEVSELGQLWLPNSPHPKAAQWRFRAGPWHTPGVTSPYEHVRTLTPNTRLDPATARVERYFPRGPIGVEDMDVIAERVGGYLRAAFGWLVREFPGALSVSLSGGLDSRLTLAASQPFSPDLRYFTYFYRGSHPVHRNDVRVARTLASRFGLAHDSWPLDTGAETDEERHAWERTHRGIHGAGRVEFSFREHLPAGHLHVRSNVLEVTRGYFIKNPLTRADEFDAARLSRLFRTGTSEFFVREYEEFMAVTGFSVEAKHDMHYTDLYHWEQRLGRWHSEVARRNKISHSTFIIWNARRVLTLMLARPAEDRYKARVIHRLIHDLWPEALETPIYSGAAYTSLEPGFPVGPAEFDWNRLPGEARRGFARALTGVDANEEEATRVLEDRVPAPDESFFASPEVAAAALSDWLPLDPLATAALGEWLRLEPTAIADAVTDGAFRRALAGALRAAGGRLPAIQDSAMLRSYLAVPTAALDPPPLQPFQVDIVDGLKAEAESRGRPPSGLIVMPPGAGRMRTVATWLLQDVARAGRRILWVSPGEELMQLAALAFAESASHLRPRSAALRLRLAGGAYGAGRAATLLRTDHDVGLATIGALNYHLEALHDLLSLGDDIVVVVDEAQHGASPALEAVQAHGVAVIGLVPALKEPERALIGAYGGAVLAQVDAEALIAGGHVARPLARVVETMVRADTELRPEDAEEGGLPPRIASRLSADEGRDETIVSTWLDGPATDQRYGPTIVYAIDDAHAARLAQRFKAANVRTVSTSPGAYYRQYQLHRFNNRELDALITVDILPEGFQLNVAGAVFLCRPTKDEGLLREMIAGALAGPQVGGPRSVDIVSFQDTWSRLTGWLRPADVLGLPTRACSSAAS